jgi:hypothetical protein
VIVYNKLEMHLFSILLRQLVDFASLFALLVDFSEQGFVEL